MSKRCHFLRELRYLDNFKTGAKCPLDTMWMSRYDMICSPILGWSLRPFQASVFEVFFGPLFEYLFVPLFDPLFGPLFGPLFRQLFRQGFWPTFCPPGEIVFRLGIIGAYQKLPRCAVLHEFYKTFTN